jgi:hypothetical protein
MDDFTLRLKWKRNRCLYDEELRKIIVNFSVKLQPKSGLDSFVLRFIVPTKLETQILDLL